jgi:hypothetical protein
MGYALWAMGQELPRLNPCFLVIPPKNTTLQEFDAPSEQPIAQVP